MAETEFLACTSLIIKFAACLNYSLSTSQNLTKSAGYRFFPRDCCIGSHHSVLSSTTHCSCWKTFVNICLFEDMTMYMYS